MDVGGSVFAGLVQLHLIKPMLDGQVKAMGDRQQICRLHQQSYKLALCLQSVLVNLPYT